MSGTKIHTVDPWTRSPDSLPRDVRFVCAYGLFLGIDTIEEEVFIRRTDDHDELWTANELGRGRAVVGSREGSEADAALALLDMLFRSRIGFEWVSDFVSGGIIDKVTFERTVSNIEGKLNDNAENALANEAEIVFTARKLGLSPTPGGLTPNHWIARCPETNHNLHIDAADNEFGCGWCKRKRGPDELRLFREDRRKWKQELSEGR